MGYKYKLPSDHPAEQDATANDVWRGFREQTSAHGIPHVSNAPGRGFLFSIVYTQYIVMTYYMDNPKGIKTG